MFSQLEIEPQFDSNLKSESLSNGINDKNEQLLVSEYLKDAFSILDVPYLGCDFEVVYPEVSSLIPKEQVTFNDFDVETAIRCELMCAAICHQINWDFLRQMVYERTKENPEWLDFDKLASISIDSVFLLLQGYHKPENIKAVERANLIHQLGAWGLAYERITDVFIDLSGEMKSYDQIYDSVHECGVFSSDPAEKKFNLLIQKLDSIKPLEGLANYANPTIDYHLIRLYLRRGLLYARTKYGFQYINNQEAERKEATVAAIRLLCSKLLQQISAYTAMTISSVNLVEWHVARSLCHRNNPDCEMNGKDGQWLKGSFDTCPFYHTCAARVQKIKQLHTINEPSYKGTSY